MSDNNSRLLPTVKLQISIEQLKAADGTGPTTPSNYRIVVEPADGQGKRFELFNNGMPIEVATAECVREVVMSMRKAGSL